MPNFAQRFGILFLYQLMRLVFSFLFLAGFWITAFAQRKGEVIIIKDPLIDSLIAKRLQLSRKDSNGGNKTTYVSQMGYRVQIFYGSDRRETFAQQDRFKSSYPKLNTYITYKEPNYYLRVGDFRTRLEAQRLLNELRAAFPTLFIFKEKINAPNLESINNDQK